jgi:hypothetical protein
MQGQTLVSQGDDGWVLAGPPGGTVPDVTLGFKDFHRHLHAAPPRIVCIAQGGDLAPVDQPGGGKNADGSYRANNRLTRQFKIRVEVWGCDDEQSESLLHNAYLAFMHLIGAPQPGKLAVFSEEDWEDQKPDAGGPETLGSLISFLVMLEINVTDAPDTLTIVRTIDNRLHEQTPAEVTHVTITS